jgi:uncharacterized protein YggL (DUF469 family)
MPFKNPHPLYQVWQGMKARCLNPNNPHYANYGKRGIKICDQWINNFNQFVKDMGERPQGYSIDRINNDGDYTPQNCKWSTKKEQQRNRRVTKHITIEGISYLICDIAEKYDFKYDTIENRTKTAKTFNELVDKTRKVYKEGLALGGKASGAKKKALTHCKAGHEFTEANTHIYKGWRRCRTCHRIRQYNRTH